MHALVKAVTAFRSDHFIELQGHEIFAGSNPVSTIVHKQFQGLLNYSPSQGAGFLRLEAAQFLTYSDLDKS